MLIAVGLLVGIWGSALAVIGEEWTGKQPGAAAPLYTLWVIVSGVCAWSVIATVRFDRESRSAVVQHRGDVERTESFRRLMLAVERLRVGSCLWTSTHGGQLRAKYHGGAETAVDRTPVTLDSGRAPHLQTARDVTRLHISFGTLHFFPDHIWVYRNGRYSIIQDESVVTSHGEQLSVETGSFPRDAAVVGQTYQYVNKDGGPDRRSRTTPQFQESATGRSTSSPAVHRRCGCSAHLPM